MLSIPLARMLAVLAAGALYWFVVGRVSGAAEPWDADDYWRAWYPVSFVLAAMAGPLFGRQGWMAGAILTFAQLPVIWVSDGPGSLWAAGLATAGVLAVPVAVISALTGWLAVRRRAA